MTPKERAEVRNAKKLAFPLAALGTTTNGARAVVKLEPGDDYFMQVMMRGKGSGWEALNIALDNIEDLGKFIHALTCRYNAMVHRANGYAEKSAMKRVSQIKAAGV